MDVLEDLQEPYIRSKVAKAEVTSVATKHGKLNVLKWLSSKCHYTSSQSNVYNITRACSSGHLEVLQWFDEILLLENRCVSHMPYIEASNLQVVEFLLNSAQLAMWSDQVIVYWASDGKLDFIQEIVQRCNRQGLRISSSIPTQAMNVACYAGHVDILDYFASTSENEWYGVKNSRWTTSCIYAIIDNREELLVWLEDKLNIMNDEEMGYHLPELYRASIFAKNMFGMKWVYHNFTTPSGLLHQLLTCAVCTTWKEGQQFLWHRGARLDPNCFCEMSFVLANDQWIHKPDFSKVDIEVLEWAFNNGAVVTIRDVESFIRYTSSVEIAQWMVTKCNIEYVPEQWIMREVVRHPGHA